MEKEVVLFVLYRLCIKYFINFIIIVIGLAVFLNYFLICNFSNFDVFFRILVFLSLFCKCF